MNFSCFCFLLIYVFDLLFVNFLYLFISLFAYLTFTMIEFFRGIFVCMCWIYFCICLCIQGFSIPWSLHCSCPRYPKAKANKGGWSVATPLEGNHVWDGFGIGQFESSFKMYFAFIYLRLIWEACYLLKKYGTKIFESHWMFGEYLAWNYENWCESFGSSWSFFLLSLTMASSALYLSLGLPGKKRAVVLLGVTNPSLMKTQKKYWTCTMTFFLVLALLPLKASSRKSWNVDVYHVCKNMFQHFSPPIFLIA